MKNKENRQVFRRSVLSVAMLLAFGVVHAQEIDPERKDAIADLADVSKQVSAGLLFVSDDNRRFGQYNGMQEAGAYLGLDFDYKRFDKSSGTGMRFQGRNLGLENRELSFEHSRQGDWKYAIGFSQTPRFEPFIVNTKLSGIGSTNLDVNDGVTAMRPVKFEMKRDLFSAGYEQVLSKNAFVRARYTHEAKNGERLFGRGATGSQNGNVVVVNGVRTTPNVDAVRAAHEFLAEPIDRRTQTLELSLGLIDEHAQLSLGYYGTLFTNHADRINVKVGTAYLTNFSGAVVNTAPAVTVGTSTVGGVTYNGIPPFDPISQPLDNHSHQVFVTGLLKLSPLTRASFKVSQTTAKQNETFVAAPANGLPTSLNGHVDTTIGFFDLTSSAVDNVDLQAMLRFEDRNDKTPVYQYLSYTPTPGTPLATNTNPSGVYAGFNGQNKPRSWSVMNGKFEAGYRTEGGKLIAAVEREDQTRNVPDPFRRVAFRAETNETFMRLETANMISEGARGSIGLIQAKRRGGDYENDTYLVGTPATSNSKLYSILWSDRDRTTVRANFDWMLTEELSVSARGEVSSDSYPSDRLHGLHSGSRQYMTVDASYQISNGWVATAYVSHDETSARQTTQTGGGASQQWETRIRMLGDAVGLGIRGKTRSGFDMGGDVTVHHDRTTFDMSQMTNSTVPGFAVLPGYYFTTTEGKFFGRYQMDKNSSVRADYIFRLWKTNEWTWTGWTYADGTYLTEDPVQKTHFVGLTYEYRWQ